MLDKRLLCILIVSPLLLLVTNEVFGATGTGYVHVEYNNGTNLTPSSVTAYNNTKPNGVTLSTNATGFSAFTQTTVFALQNYTVKESTDNFVIFKTWNVNFTGTGTLVEHTNVFTVNCPNWSGNSVVFKVNSTDGHRISAFTSSCDSNDKVTGSITFLAGGKSSTTYTSSMIAKIVDTTHYDHNAFTFTMAGTNIATSYSSPKITSSSFNVGSGLSSSTKAYVLQLGALPYAPTSATASATSSTVIKISWTAKANYTGFMIERSLNNSTWSTVNSNTGTLTQNYNDTGLTQNTQYYYRVSAINTLGTSSPSNIPTATTPKALGTSYVHALYNNGTNIASARIIQYNETFPNGKTLTANSTGFTSSITQIYKLQNFTVIEPTDNYTVFKDWNVNFTGTGTRTETSWIYTINCPAQGAGNKVEIKFNGTDGHRQTWSVAPQCNNKDVIAGTLKFLPTGKSGQSYNSSMIIRPLVTAYKHNTGGLKVNGTLYSAPYSAPKITSSKFVVGTALQSRTFIIAVQMIAPPLVPQNLTATALSYSQVQLTWGTNGFVGGYKIERSLNNSTWSTVVNNTNNALTNYNNTGLTQLTTYYYRVSSWNTLGGSAPSSVKSVTTPSQLINIIVHVEYNNGTNLSPATVTQANSTNPNGQTFNVNSTGYTQNMGAIQNTNQNFTIKETTNNFVVKKTINTNANNGGLFIYPTNIFTIDCPNSGTGNDLQLEFNGTDSHYITALTVSSCDSQDTVTGSITWTELNKSPNQYSSKLLGTILNGKYAHNAFKFILGGITQTPPAYAGGKITSQPFIVGTGQQNTTYSYTLQLGSSPNVPTGLTGKIVSTTAINLNWHVTGVWTAFLLERSLNNSTWTTVDGNVTKLYYNDTGLASTTQYFYRVSTINPLATSSPSSIFTISTPSVDPIPANAGAIDVLQACTRASVTEWAVLAVLPIAVFFGIYSTMTMTGKDESGG